MLYLTQIFNILTGFFIGYCVAYNNSSSKQTLKNCYLLNKPILFDDSGMCEKDMVDIKRDNNDENNIDLQCCLKHTKEIRMKTKISNILRDYREMSTRNKILINENKTLIERLERMSIRNRLLCRLANRENCKGFLIRTHIKTHYNCSDDEFPLVRMASNEV